jgi:hypothetical protein
LNDGAALETARMVRRILAVGRGGRFHDGPDYPFGSGLSEAVFKKRPGESVLPQLLRNDSKAVQAVCLRIPLA